MIRKLLFVAALTALSGIATLAHSQTRLPSVQRFQQDYLDEHAQQQQVQRAREAAYNYPSELSESDTLSSLPSALPNEPAVADAEIIVQPQKRGPGKPGLVQQLSFSSTWIPSMDGAEDYGTTSFEVYTVLGFPMPTRESPMLLKPGFEMHLLEAPVGLDLPEQLFDEYLQIRWMSKIGDKWGVDLSITPGIHGDFEELDSDAFRMTAHALFSYDWSPELMLVGGVLYLDSEVMDFVPAAGAIWKPDENTKWELIVPRPRFAHRYFQDCDSEKWWYVAGEYSNNQWAITRDGNVRDTLSMQDLKLLVGVERKDITGIGLSSRFEVGYVFGRQLEFTSGLPDIDGGDTVMMRASVWY